MNTQILVGLGGYGKWPVMANVKDGIAVHADYMMETFGPFHSGKLIWTGVYSVTHVESGVSLGIKPSLSEALERRNEILGVDFGGVHVGTLPTCELFILAPVIAERLRSRYPGKDYATPETVANNARILAEMADCVEAQA